MTRNLVTDRGCLRMFVVFISKVYALNFECTCAHTPVPAARRMP